jgi:hypothetical protein
MLLWVEQTVLRMLWARPPRAARTRDACTADGPHAHVEVSLDAVVSGPLRWVVRRPVSLVCHVMDAKAAVRGESGVRNRKLWFVALLRAQGVGSACGSGYVLR